MILKVQDVPSALWEDLHIVTLSLWLTLINVTVIGGLALLIQYPGRRDLYTSPSFISFLETEEGEGLHYQWTEESGTTGPNSKHYCMCREIHRNYETGCKIISEQSETEH